MASSGSRRLPDRSDIAAPPPQLSPELPSATPGSVRLAGSTRSGPADVAPAWLTATMIAVDLLAFAQTLLLHDTGLARAEPKALRYRLLHVAACGVPDVGPGSLNSGGLRVGMIPT